MGCKGAESSVRTWSGSGETTRMAGKRSRKKEREKEKQTIRFGSVEKPTNETTKRGIHQEELEKHVLVLEVVWKVAALDGNAGQNVGNVAIRQAFQFGGKILATRVDYALVLLETMGREIRSGTPGNCVIDLAMNGNMQRNGREGHGRFLALFRSRFNLNSENFDETRLNR